MRKIAGLLRDGLPLLFGGVVPVPWLLVVFVVGALVVVVLSSTMVKPMVEHEIASPSSEAFTLGSKRFIIDENVAFVSIRGRPYIT